MLGQRLLAAIFVVVLLVVGVWLLGGKVTNDFTAAMVLVGAWIAALGIASLGLVLRNRQWWIVLAAYAVAAGAVSVYLGRSTFLDDEVDEQVVQAAPATGGPRAGRGAQAGGRRVGNVLVARGDFESLAHPTEGVASVVELPEGSRTLTLTRFEVDNGPDLRVYLTTRPPGNGSDLGDFEDLGALKGNKGDQQYSIPEGVDVTSYSTAVVWCRAFSVAFGQARLRGQ